MKVMEVAATIAHRLLTPIMLVVSCCIAHKLSELPLGGAVELFFSQLSVVALASVGVTGVVALTLAALDGGGER